MPLRTEPTSVCRATVRCGVHIDALFRRIADKKCPWTSNVSIRGRILSGKVISTKMTRTIIVRRDYLHYVPKYRESHSSMSFALDVLADRPFVNSKIGTRSGTRTSPRTSHLHSVSKWATS